LATYYTFSQFDPEIIKRHRRDHNRLGFTVQLCVLRYPGWSLSDIEPIPNYVIQYISRQLNANPVSFSLYTQRDPKEYSIKEFVAVTGISQGSLLRAINQRKLQETET
jgi:TnpA family transposase